jgi:hypothetical protein
MLLGYAPFYLARVGYTVSEKHGLLVEDRPVGYSRVDVGDTNRTINPCLGDANLRLFTIVFSGGCVGTHPDDATVLSLFSGLFVFLEELFLVSKEQTHPLFPLLLAQRARVRIQSII